MGFLPIHNRNKQPKILAIFPPIFPSVRAVPLTIPWIVSAFQDAGFSCNSADLNVQLLRHLVSTEGQIELHGHFVSMVDSFQNQSFLDSSERLLLARYALALSWEGWDSHGNIWSKSPEINATNNEFSPLNILARFGRWAEINKTTNDEVLEWDEDELRYFAESRPISPIGRWLNEMIRQLATADIYCITVMDEWQVPFAFRIAYQLKQLYSNIFVVMGGAYFRALGNDVFLFNSMTDIADCVWLGGIRSFVKTINSDKSNSISGVFWNKTDICELLNLSVIDQLARIKQELYWSKQLILPFILSQGCYFGKCSFCSEPSIYKYKELPTLQASTLLGHLLAQTKPARIVFNDTILSPRRAVLVSECFETYKNNIIWDFQTRFDLSFNEPLLNRLKQSGCLFIEMGLESFNRDTRERINKDVPEDTISRNLTDLQNSGLPVILNIIYGFPWESADIVDQTRKGMQRISVLYPKLNVRYNIQAFKVYKLSQIGISMKESKNIWPLSTRLFWQSSKWIEQTDPYENIHTYTCSKDVTGKAAVNQRRLFKSYHSVESSSVDRINGFYYVIGGDRIDQRSLFRISSDLYSLLTKANGCDKLKHSSPEAYKTLVEQRVIHVPSSTKDRV